VHIAALWAALFTLAAKEGLFRYVLRVAQRVRSSMLIANAWHARSDAASSLVVAAGIGGNLLGFTFLDSLAAALVGFMIARMGWQFAWSALSDLMDRGLSPEEVEAIRAAFLAAPGVRGLHELRTRKMGDLSVIDAHILVDPHISVSEGHFIAEKARASVMKQFHTLDVLVHIDPEDDDLASPSAHLPGREAILAELRRDLGAWLPEDSRIQLHYLDGKVEVDLFLTLPQNFSAAETAALYAGINRLTSSSSFREVRLHTPFNVS
jgi:divalent metal cation (Fe/Co/Zn/Cd) transporter